MAQQLGSLKTPSTMTNTKDLLLRILELNAENSEIKMKNVKSKLDVIKSSKFFRLWPFYIKAKLILFKLGIKQRG